MTGTIIKALSGFYYVDVGAEHEPVTCRGRGKLRHQKVTPLVGDHVAITMTEDGTGMVDEVLPRANQFQRPMVANMDQLVILASGAIPITDPFLIDRMISLAEYKGCEPIICFNKCDLEPAQEMVELYRQAGFQCFAISAYTGEGLEQLMEILNGKISAFTGNSGVGKSSVLNALCPQFDLKVGHGENTKIEIIKSSISAVVSDEVLNPKKEEKKDKKAIEDKNQIKEELEKAQSEEKKE